MAPKKRPLSIPPEQQTFGQALRWAREQRGMTLRQLGAALGGLTAAFLCDVEHDRRQTNRVEELARVLDVPLAELEARQGVTEDLTDWLAKNPKLIRLLRDIRAHRCRPLVLKTLGLQR